MSIIDAAIARAEAGHSVWLRNMSLECAEAIRDGIAASGAVVVCEMLKPTKGSPESACWAVRITKSRHRE